MVWYGMVWYGMVWYGMVWYGMVWYGMVWYVMVLYGIVLYCMVWYGIMWYRPIKSPFLFYVASLSQRLHQTQLINEGKCVIYGIKRDLTKISIPIFSFFYITMVTSTYT